MKAVLEFNLPEEREEFNTANKAGSMSCALFEIRQRMFRPARKHGYPPGEILDLLSSADEKSNDLMITLIYLLEKEFSSICEEYEVLDFT